MSRRLLQLDVENFRSLRRVSLPLGPLTVLVGPNAVGKTNVLRVFGFLADIIGSDLEPALQARGGFDEVAFWGGPRPPTVLRIKVTANWSTHASTNAPDEYQLAVHRRSLPGDPGRFVLRREETFRFKRTRGRGRRIKISGERAEVVDVLAGADEQRQTEVGIRKLSSGLSTLPRLARTEGGAEVSALAQRLSSFRVFDVFVEAARLPTAMLPGRSLGSVQLRPDAANLAAFLLRLRELNNEAWDRLVEDARAVLPHVEGIELQRVGGATEAVAVLLRERGLRRPTPLADASYGTVRLLGLLALLYDPELPALTCVEEIDHGLHPQALELLVSRLREASRRGQFLVATHSPALVNRLEPREFVVCERDKEGASRIPALGVDQVREIVHGSEDLPLGDLWFSGVLGGGL